MFYWSWKTRHKLLVFAPMFVVSTAIWSWLGGTTSRPIEFAVAVTFFSVPQSFLWIIFLAFKTGVLSVNYGGKVFKKDTPNWFNLLLSIYILLAIFILWVCVTVITHIAKNGLV